MIHRAIFLDRDGVLNRTFVKNGVPYPPSTLAEFEILPRVSAAIDWFRHAGFRLIVVTNQPDVARGTQTQTRVEQINSELRARIAIDDIIVCYHDTPDRCDCRKPKPGMLIQAATTYGIDLSQSFMVGDRWSDIVAGTEVGCTTLLLDQAYSQRERCKPDYLVADLWEAAQVIARCIGHRIDLPNGETL